MRRTWHLTGDLDDVRVVSSTDRYRVLSTRYLRDRSPVRLSECLLYPFKDGPGVGLLVFFPPALWLLTLPIFDVIAVLQPFTKGDWALGLLVLPVFGPLLFSFVMTLGYVLLVLGQMLVASAMGDGDHPRWPEWHPNQIAEGIGRWLWASLFGAVLAGFPIIAYWVRCGDLDWFDRVVITELVVVAAGYAQMALAAALLHDNIIAANPITVISAVVRIGWRYLQPSLVAGIALIMIFGAFSAVLSEVSSLKVAFAALWIFWVFTLYTGMVVMRMIGLTYYLHANQLGWFRRLPRWGLPTRVGKIYSNS